MRASVVQRVALSLVVLGILGGCADLVQPVPSVDPAVKAGAKTGPVAIRIADSQWRGRPSNLPLDEFKRQVESASGGSMAVESVGKSDTLHFVQLSGPADWALELPWPRVGDLP